MTHYKSAKDLSQKFRHAYIMHRKILSFCSLKQSYSKKNYSSGVIILNLFLFRRLKQTPINSKTIILQFNQIQNPIKQQLYMQMQKLSLHFPSPSSDLGNSLSTTSTKLVLDMTRTCPFIFQTMPSPFSFRVLDSFMTVHLLLMTVQLQLFQILPLFHSNNNNKNNRSWNANTVIELAIWKIIVLIFIHVSTVIKPAILHTDASEINILQEQRFILDGSLLGNGHQQPRRYSKHMSELVPEYWTILQLSFLHLLTLYLTGGEMMVIYKLQSHIKRAWATTCHTSFRVVARDKDAWTCLQLAIWDTSSSRRLQLLAIFGRVPGIALSIPELLVILKPSQVETSIFRLKF